MPADWCGWIGLLLPDILPLPNRRYKDWLLSLLPCLFLAGVESPALYYTGQPRQTVHISYSCLLKFPTILIPEAVPASWPGKPGRRLPDTVSRHVRYWACRNNNWTGRSRLPPVRGYGNTSPCACRVTRILAGGSLRRRSNCRTECWGLSPFLPWTWLPAWRDRLSNGHLYW